MSNNKIKSILVMVKKPRVIILTVVLVMLIVFSWVIIPQILDYLNRELFTNLLSRDYSSRIEFTGEKHFGSMPITFAKLESMDGGITSSIIYESIGFINPDITPDNIIYVLTDRGSKYYKQGKGFAYAKSRFNELIGYTEIPDKDVRTVKLKFTYLYYDFEDWVWESDLLKNMYKEQQALLYETECVYKFVENEWISDLS